MINVGGTHSVKLFNLACEIEHGVVGSKSETLSHPRLEVRRSLFSNLQRRCYVCAGLDEIVVRAAWQLGDFAERIELGLACHELLKVRRQAPHSFKLGLQGLEPLLLGLDRRNFILDGLKSIARFDPYLGAYLGTFQLRRSLRQPRFGLGIFALASA